MFTITPIGSCRITTPLRRGQSVHGFHLNMDRCYGYCHSPAEAVQMARFMRGSADIPQDVWPLVSRKHDLKILSASSHAASDIYVVELASAKEVTIGGVSIQLNYLNAAFPDFFADANRAQSFWALAEANERSEMTAFLERNWSATPEQQTQAETLGKMRLSFVTREGLQRDIKTLTEILPDVLFVSHVDACKADGRPIRSRSGFIQMVADEVERAGCKLYNPTTLMHEFGQAAAIEDESAGLAHFTDAFSTGIMNDWMQQVVAVKTDDAVRHDIPGAMDEQLQPQISAARRNGQFVTTVTRLKALSLAGVAVDALLDQTVASQEQARVAFLDQVEADPDSGLTVEIGAQRVLAASQLGLFDDVLRLANRVPGGLADWPAYTLLQIGDLATLAGETDIAIEFFRAAAAQGQTRAGRTLADLSIAQKTDVLADMTQDQRVRFLSDATPVQRLQLLDLNGASFTQAVSQETTPGETEEIITYLARTHGIGYAAEVLAFWRELQGTDRITDTALVGALDDWVATALSLEERVERIHGINAVLYAAPRHQAARVAMQSVRKELALLIRAAGKAGDIDLLDELCVDAHALTTALPELDLWRARLRFSLGEFETAIELGRSAAEFLPRKINIWVLLMRAAFKLELPSETDEFARKVIGLATSDTAALKIEAEKVLQSDLVGV